MATTSGNTSKVEAEYIEEIAVRSHRAESLAARIEEGAAGLAVFAEGLSDAEWRTPVSPTDRRSVGVIVHHVASMYPIEINVARAIASGRSVSDVTWEVVAQLNAKHAQDNAQVSNPAALELLRRTAGTRPLPCVLSPIKNSIARLHSRLVSVHRLRLSSLSRTMQCDIAGITWRRFERQ